MWLLSPTIECVGTSFLPSAQAVKVAKTTAATTRCTARFLMNVIGFSLSKWALITLGK
ncbi:hypothetical protein [Moraxella lacunata]|uniref:hypothetical protein n=1 Tax=Moraxella lacunata TaxID=477 RepID=UPI003EDE8A3E